MVIDDPTLARIEHEQPALAADLLRYLSATADERTSFNLTFHGRGTSTGPRTVEAYLCRSREMLESAQRLRYEVYCGELGRISPNADHDKKIITDHLDAKAWIFVAIEDDEVVGTLRGNKSDVGPLGFIEELYGMTASPHHPTATTVATKFIVRKSKRGGVASMKLIAALVRLGLHNNVKECYIDAVPALVPFYEGLGFEITGGSFLHRENGPSYPMKVDLGKHGERLSRETGLI